MGNDENYFHFVKMLSAGTGAKAICGHLKGKEGGPA